MYAINNSWWKGNDQVLLGWKNDERLLPWIRNERLLRNVYALFLGQVISFLLALSSFFSSSLIDLGKFLFFSSFQFSVFGDFRIIFCLNSVFCGLCRCECASHPQFLRLSALSSGFWDYQAG